ncbi:arginase [Clonorchis sinensis]|uniref:Arginase n=1 Tax=Clonorchis sinensis TaxID=79923 RepID=G7YVF0_CLOSI|nr:arginase [Clonorchis sinensis]
MKDLRQPVISFAILGIRQNSLAVGNNNMTRWIRVFDNLYRTSTVGRLNGSRNACVNNSNGFRLRDLSENHIRLGRNLSVVELVELNPLIGTQCEVDRTTSTAVTLLKACLGYRRSGNLPRKLHSLSDEGILSRADKRKKNDHDG